MPIETPPEAPIFKDLNTVVGITSRVLSNVGRKGQCTGHWLLFDVDDIFEAGNCMRWIRSTFKQSVPLRFYSTPDGYHFILFKRHTLKQAYETLKLCPYVDRQWVERGYKRKYWFLDTHGRRTFPKRVEYMKIRRSEKVAEGKS